MTVPAATLLAAVAVQVEPAVDVVEHEMIVLPPDQVKELFEGVTFCKLQVIALPT